MRYVNARIEKEYRDLTYRIYVTDSLIDNNKHIDTRSGDEIVEDIMLRGGLKFRSN